jgi:hypothetical protein
MKNLCCALVLLSLTMSACGQSRTLAPTPGATVITTPSGTATPSLTATSAVTETSTPLPTATPTLMQELGYTPESYGPAGFPAGVDPLTGLQVPNPALLKRRPLLVKVSNLPREVRPQWGLSLADLVFEYYTEEGSTRFAAIFYGNDAKMVGPIRSGRFIDAYLVDGYKAVFAFGGAYAAEMDTFLRSDFANRMVTEAPFMPLKRYDPNGLNYLVANTADLTAYATRRGINGVQNLNNMLFNSAAPAAGQSAPQLYVHYSGATYSRWDYDPSSGKYLRFSDTAAVTSVGQTEQFAALTDRLTGQPLAFDNVVVLYVNHKVYSTDTNGTSIYDIFLSGSGDAYAFRDGQAYQVKWQRRAADVVSLAYPDGSPFPFKPGTTCFEVIGLKSTLSQTGQTWRFVHLMP